MSSFEPDSGRHGGVPTVASEDIDVGGYVDVVAEVGEELAGGNVPIPFVRAVAMRKVVKESETEVLKMFEVGFADFAEQEALESEVAVKLRAGRPRMGWGRRKCASSTARQAPNRSK